MSTILPFESFLELLRAKGYSVSLHEHFAVARLLERWDRTDAGELRDALAALIARNDEEVEGIRRLFDELHAPAPTAAPPPPPPPTPSFRWLWALGALASIAAAAVLIWRMSLVTLPVLPPSPAATLPEALSPIPIPPDAGDIVASTDIRRRATVAPSLPPPPGLPVPPTLLVRAALAETAGVSLLCAFVLFWRLKARRSTHHWLRRAWRSALGSLPGPFQPELVVRDVTRRLPRLDLEDAAMILGRIYGTDARTRELDVRESLRLTLKHGLLPHLVYKRLHAAGPLVVVEDISQAMDPWRDKVRALLGDLARQGIPLERWYFDGDPRRLSEKPHGALAPLEYVVGRRPDSPILVLSTGEGLVPVLETLDTRWLQALRQCPRRTWVTPLTDPGLWPETLSSVPMHVWPMTRNGLTQAARELAGFATGTSVRARVLSEGRVTRDHVERLKRLASLVPHPTIELLESLRRRFAPDVPDSTTAYLFRESGSEGLRVLRLSEEEVKRCAEVVRRETPTLEAAVRKAVLAVLRDSTPVSGSAAHLRWQMAVALQEVSLAHVQKTDAAAPLAVLRSLGRGPLWEEVTSAVKLLPGAARIGVRRARASLVQLGTRSVPPPDNGELGRWTPKPRSLPGARELIPAGLSTLMLCVAAWSAGVFPTVTLAHVQDAYRLAFVPGGGGAARRLELNIADGSSPRTVDLYRDGQLYLPQIRVGAVGEPLAIPLPADGTGNYYQARATLPMRNLALSNAVWVPSVNLIVVLVDAQPWARVTIDGAGTHLEPGITPFSLLLAPGSYRVQLENGNLTPPRQDDIQVAPGNQEFRFVMPGFDADRTAADLVRSP